MMKAGLIGLGPMGKRIIAALSRLTDVELAAVCDLRHDVLDDINLESTVQKFSDASQLMESTKLDLLVIATTAPSHAHLVRGAVNAGIRNIMCEKPIATSLADAQEMLDICKKNEVRLAVNHSRRMDPGYQWLAAKVQSGDFGSLRGIRIACPGIGLGCLATHFLDTMRFISGEDFSHIVGWVDKEMGRNPRGSEFHDPGGLIVATGSKGSRFIHHQIEDAAGPTSIVLDLTRARIIVDEFEKRFNIIWRDPSVIPGPGRPPRFEKVEAPPEFPLKLDIIEMTAGVLKELVENQSLACDAHHAYLSIEAVIAAYQSQESGNVPIKLPLTDSTILTREFPIT